MQAKTDEYYMQLAIEEAKKAAERGEIPIGAVLVANGEVISAAHNMRETWHDATAHAEMITIIEACAVLERWRLNDATLYVTLEPCPMCAGAIVNSRLKRLVYGCPDFKAGAAESIFNIVSNTNLNHAVEVTSGVCEEECAAVLKDFLKSAVRKTNSRNKNNYATWQKVKLIV